MWSTCLLTIRGSYTGRRSSRTQAGIPCRESSLAAWGLDLESASASASSEDLGGAGITGDTIGMAVQRYTTTTLISRIAERSLIAITSIEAILVTATSTTATRSTEAILGAEVGVSTGRQRLTFSQEHAPVRSAALITAEMREDFPPEGDQASEVALTGASMAVADAIRHSDVRMWNLSRIQEWRRTSCCSGFQFLLNLNASAFIESLRPFCSHSPSGVCLHQCSPSSRDSRPLPPPKMRVALSLRQCRRRTIKVH